MKPEELLRNVYRYIDSCFASGMELTEVLSRLEDYIAASEGMAAE